MKYRLILVFIVGILVLTFSILGCSSKHAEIVPLQPVFDYPDAKGGNFVDDTLNPPSQNEKETAIKEKIILSGTVSNDNSRLLDGAKVIAITVKPEGIDLNDINPDAVEVTTVTDNGKYSMEIVPSYYRIEVECDKHLKYTEKTFKLYMSNETKDIELTALSSLVVDVYDEDGLTPVSGATVLLKSNSDTKGTFEMRSDGKYYLEDVLPGNYTINANCGESPRKEGSKDIELKSEETKKESVILAVVNVGSASDSGMQEEIQSKVESGSGR